MTSQAVRGDGNSYCRRRPRSARAAVLYVCAKGRGHQNNSSYSNQKDRLYSTGQACSHIVQGCGRRYTLLSLLHGCTKHAQYFLICTSRVVTIVVRITHESSVYCKLATFMRRTMSAHALNVCGCLIHRPSQVNRRLSAQHGATIHASSVDMSASRISSCRYTFVLSTCLCV